MPSAESASLPEGLTAQSDLDGQRITLPGLQLSRKDMVRTLAMLSAAPTLLMWGILLFKTFSSGVWSWSDFLVIGPIAMLIAVLTSLLFLPFPGLGWLRAEGSFITVQINPLRFIRYEYLQSELTQVIPTSAIQTVAAPAEGEPRLVLTVDWSNDGIQCSPLARDKPLVWRVRTRAQAQWLALEGVFDGALEQEALDGRKVFD